MKLNKNSAFSVLWTSHGFSSTVVNYVGDTQAVTRLFFPTSSPKFLVNYDLYITGRKNFE